MSPPSIHLRTAPEFGSAKLRDLLNPQLLSSATMKDMSRQAQSHKQDDPRPCAPLSLGHESSRGDALAGSRWHNTAPLPLRSADRQIASRNPAVADASLHQAEATHRCRDGFSSSNDKSTWRRASPVFSSSNQETSSFPSRSYDSARPQVLASTVKLRNSCERSSATSSISFPSMALSSRKVAYIKVTSHPSYNEQATTPTPHSLPSIRHIFEAVDSAHSDL